MEDKLRTSYTFSVEAAGSSDSAFDELVVVPAVATSAPLMDWSSEVCSKETRLARVRKVLETHEFKDGVFSKGRDGISLSELVHKIPYDAAGLMQETSEDAVFVREKIMNLHWRNSYLLALWALRAAHSSDPKIHEEFLFFLGDWDYATDFSETTNKSIVRALSIASPSTWMTTCTKNVGSARTAMHIAIEQDDTESALAIASVQAANNYSWLLSEYFHLLQSGVIRRPMMSRTIQTIRNLGGARPAIERALPYVLA